MNIILSTLLLLISFPAFSQIADWGPPRKLADPKDSSVTINVAGDPHFGFYEGFVLGGKSPNGFVDLTATVIYFRKGEYWGRFSVNENTQGYGFPETTAIKDIKQFPYWRNKIVDPSSNGVFQFNKVVVR